MELNKYQTVITDELKQSLPREVYENLIEYTSTIKFVKNLIAHESIRGYAKDRPKSTLYDDNRIDVDITNPHILEDMDYFRQPAIFFENQLMQQYIQLLLVLYGKDKCMSVALVFQLILHNH